jgi:hypothetical protein
MYYHNSVVLFFFSLKRVKVKVDDYYNSGEELTPLFFPVCLVEYYNFSAEKA